MPNEDGNLRLDSLSLRALAHPMRVRLLSLLRSEGPATTTMLADRVGQRSGTIAWHVKQLAKHGLIEEIAGRGVGRERWWGAAQRRTELDLDALSGDPALAAPLQAYVRGVLDTNFRRAAGWLSREWDPEWSRSATMSDWTLRANPERLGELVEEIRAVIERHTELSDDDGERVVVQLQAFPHRTE